jgi:tetratricopeptide (TPR) repeat protein
MKKVIVLISLLIIFTSAFAQRGKVNSAYTNLQGGKLTKAKELIDAASVHKKTKDNPKTWVFRGDIYVEIATSNLSGVVIDAEALPKAIEAFKRAKELDTENEYAENIKNGYKNVSIASYNTGVNFYNKKDYVSAADNFSKAFELKSTINETDTNSMYNAAIAYNLGGQKEKAAVYYKKLIDIKYDDASIYKEYFDIMYEKEESKEEALATLAIGRKLYPEDYSMIVSEANYFLSSNQTDKAIANLELALTYESTNHSIFHAIGTMYNMIFTNEEKDEKTRMLAYDKAVDAYKKTIELEPMFFDANYNLGAIIFNKGVFFLEKADSLPLGDESYDGLKEKGNSFLLEALPYLEKAFEINPKDQNTLVSLKQIYTRTKNVEKYNKMKKCLEELEVK